MIIRNKVFDGRGIRKWYWYFYFELLVLLFKKVELDKCTIKRFDFKRWETKYFQFARFAFREYQEKKIVAKI